MSFTQQGPRTVCVLSANGAVSNVTLRQPAMSAGTVSYEVILVFPSVALFLISVLPVTIPLGELRNYSMVLSNHERSFCFKAFELEDYAMHQFDVTN